MRINILATSLALILASTTASAGQIIAQLSGLSGTDHVTDFGNSLYPNFTPITTEFPGLTFSHARYFTTGSVNNMVGGFLTNDFSGPPDTLTIIFANPITDLSFAYHQIGTSQPSVYRAMLGGVLVDTFSHLSDQYQPNNYFGFTNLLFDELQLDFVSDFNIDYLAYNDAGGPGTNYCFGDGLGTGCPCGNNNNGAQGGCDWGNPVFPQGGVLDATGSSSMAAADTFLVATGIENNFGIFFGANDQVNGGNGNPLNDGLRCAGGALVRLTPPTPATGNQANTPMPVQTLDTGATSGMTRRYQYWFRTPGGPCGTSANLTNGYEIVWTP